MAIQRQDGWISAVNSTTAPLGGSGTFTGEWEDVTCSAFIRITILADQGSASDGLKLQWSNDGSMMVFEESSSVSANVGRGFAITTRAKYFRIQYVNGATPQGSFTLQCICHVSGTGLISRPLDKQLTDDNFAQTVRSVTSGKKSNGDYLSSNITDNGGLHANLRNNAGTEIGTSANPMNVQVGDGTRTATVRDTGTSDSLNVAITDASGNQITSFGGGTQYAEDNPSVGGESMTLAGAIRQDTPTTTTSADGDYANLKTDSLGRLWVNASGVTQPVSGTVTANAGSGTMATNPSSSTTRDIGRVNAPNPTEAAGAYLNVRLTDGSGFYVAGSSAEPNTFYAYFDRIAPASNKYMATLFNTSATRKVVVRRIVLINNTITSVTGVLLDQYLARITARTAGTSVTIRSRDSNDSLSAGITADTGSTSVTEEYVAKRFIASSEEPVVAQTMLTAFGTYGGVVLYEKADGMKGETLRQNQGISIRNVTSSTVGVVSYCIEFTDEAS
jgi:hypothetical protein